MSPVRFGECPVDVGAPWDWGMSEQNDAIFERAVGFPCQLFAATAP